MKHYKKISKKIIFGILFCIVIFGGVGVLAKLNILPVLKNLFYKADTPAADPLIGIPKFPTVVNWHSLNEVAPPSGVNEEVDWTFEKDHLDWALASDHFTGLKSRGATTKLSKYILLNSTDGVIGPREAAFTTFSVPDSLTDGYKELEEMQTFCATRGLNFEDSFLHYSDSTTYNVYRNIDADPELEVAWINSVNGAATKSQSTRVTHDIGHGPFYVLYHKSPCVQQYKAMRVNRFIDSDENGEKYSGNYTYDSFFIDEMTGGTNDSLNVTNTGGHIIEYGNKKKEDIDDTVYATDQASLISYVHTQVGLPLFSNTTNQVSDIQKIVATAGGAALSEFLCSQKHIFFNGEQFFWDRVKSNFLDQGSYFAWMEAESAGIDGITEESNYPDLSARHSMYALSSYLMAKDHGYKTFFAQKSNRPWGTPISSYWYKAREANLGQPTGDYFLWQADSNTFRRNYDYGVMVLFRTYKDWDDPDEATKLNTKSSMYSLGGNYRILYADGTLGPVISQIGISLSEGVVLVPDGYDPFAGGGSSPTPTPTPSQNVEVSLNPSPLGSYTAGAEIPVTVNLKPNGNQVCSVTTTVSFPSSTISYVSGSASVVDSNTQILGTPYVNDVGNIKFLVGLKNCTTQTQDILTLKLTGTTAGTASIDLVTRIVGGPNPDSPIDLTATNTGTSVTIAGALTPMPKTSLSITNGAVPNAKGYYTTSPIFRITATPVSGKTIKEIDYQWDGGTVTRVLFSTTVSNITAPGDGNRTLTYWAIGSDDVEEIPHNYSITYQIDTKAPSPPSDETARDKTYKSSFSIGGTAGTDTEKIYINSTELSVSEYVKPNWSKVVSLSISKDANGLAAPTVFTVEAEDSAGNRASKVISITRHGMGDITGDMKVDGTDFSGIMGGWGSPNPYYMADYNEDAACDELDFAILMYRWGIVPV